MDNELQKQAAAAIRHLKFENDELRAQLEMIQEAEKLAFTLFHQGAISVDQIESTIKEYSTKPKAELEILKKASELTKTATDSSFASFKLSSRADEGGYSATDRFNRMLLED